MAIEDTIFHVLSLAQILKRPNPQYVVVAILLELNIPTHHMGFECLKRAILFFCEDPTLLVTKEIYRKVAKSFEGDVRPSQVEQTIRQAISAAWDNSDLTAMIRYFSQEKGGIMKKPTNSAFISRVGRIVELWQGCREKEAVYYE